MAKTIRTLKDEKGNTFIDARDVIDLLKANQSNINQSVNQYNQIINSLRLEVLNEKIEGRKKKS